MTDRDKPTQTTEPEQRLAGKSSEVNTGVPGIRRAVNDPEQLADGSGVPEDLPRPEDPLLRAAEEPLEGPDRTALVEFCSDEVLEDDPTLTDRTEWTDSPLEEELTIHDPEDEL